MKLDNMSSDDSEYLDSGRLGSIKVPKSKAPRTLNEKNINYFEIPKKEKELNWPAPQGCPYPIHNLIDDRHENCGGAPTDESWKEQIREEVAGNMTSVEATEHLIGVIASFLKKEREKALFDLCEAWEAGNEAGKSEAFSLVRKLTEPLILRQSNQHKLSEKFWRNGGNKALQRLLNHALSEFLDKLSTLEGK